MNTLELFKEDVWTGIAQHAKKLIPATIVATIIYLIVVIASMIAIFSSILDKSMIEEINNMSQANPFDVEAMQERSLFFKEMILDIGVKTFVTTILLFLVVATFAGSWFINFMLLLSQDTLTMGKASVGDAFKKSFNRDVLRIVGLNILLTILFLFLYLISFMLLKINFIFVVLGMLITFLIMLRFTASIGAIVHGQMGIAEAMSFSWKNITFKSAMKIFLILIAVFLVMLLVAALFAAIFGMMGKVGSILSGIFQLAFTVIYYAFGYAALSAAFFRYADVEIQTDEVSHLLEED